MHPLRRWISALLSVGWLAPFVLAWSSVLTYLNDDLARLQLIQPRPLPSSELVINEALNITHAREMLYLSAGWLALVIFGWTLHVLRRPAAVGEAAVVVPPAEQMPVLTESVDVTPVEQASALPSDLDGLMATRLQQLDAQLERLGRLTSPMAPVAPVAPVAPTPQVDDELRADLKALLGQRLRALDERLDSVVSLISQAQAERPAPVVAVAAAPVLDEEALRTSLQELLNQRFDTLGEQLASLGSPLRESSTLLDQRLDDLQRLLAQVQTAAVAPPVSADVIVQSVAANDAKRLKQVVLNLADLQADLRMLRRKQSNG